MSVAFSFLEIPRQSTLWIRLRAPAALTRQSADIDKGQIEKINPAFYFFGLRQSSSSQ